MFQIIFNAISAAELSRLPRSLQLEIMGDFHVSPEDLENLGSDSRFGRVSRNGKNLFRYRTPDYRIYFERCDEGIMVHRILHKNTLSDFLYRSKLPTGPTLTLSPT